MERAIGVSFVGLSALLLAGCGGRYAGFRTGSYSCTAVIASNTCPDTTSEGTMVVEANGGGDLLSIVGPYGVGSRAWSTIQFGAQGNPDAYDIMVGCAGMHAAIVEVGTESLVYDTTTSYTTTICGTGTVCAITYEVTCAALH